MVLAKWKILSGWVEGRVAHHGDGGFPKAQTGMRLSQYPAVLNPADRLVEKLLPRGLDSLRQNVLRGDQAG